MCMLVDVNMVQVKLILDFFLGLIGGGFGLVVVVVVGVMVVVGVFFEEDVLGVVFLVVLIMSLELVFFIGKKDMEFLDEEMFVDVVMLDVKIKVEDVDIIVIFGDFFLFFVVVQIGKSEFLDCFVGL